MKYMLLIPLQLLIYFVILIGCLRSGALLVDMHDDLAFLAGIGAYLCAFPVTILFVWLIYQTTKGKTSNHAS